MVPSFCSTSVHETPRQPRSAARASPTGPPPPIRTGVWRLALNCLGGARADEPGRDRRQPDAEKQLTE